MLAFLQANALGGFTKEKDLELLELKVLLISDNYILILLIKLQLTKAARRSKRIKRQTL